MWSDFGADLFDVSASHPLTEIHARGTVATRADASRQEDGDWRSSWIVYCCPPLIPRWVLTLIPYVNHLPAPFTRGLRVSVGGAGLAFGLEHPVTQDSLGVYWRVDGQDLNMGTWTAGGLVRRVTAVRRKSELQDYPRLCTTLAVVVERLSVSQPKAEEILLGLSLEVHRMEEPTYSGMPTNVSYGVEEFAFTLSSGFALGDWQLYIQCQGVVCESVHHLTTHGYTSMSVEEPQAKDMGRVVAMA